jgi:hypothetical protein
MLIENVLATPGLVMLTGSQRSGKTVIAAQMAIAVMTKHPFMDNWRITEKSPVIIVELDDQGGDWSMQDYLAKSPVPVNKLPLRFYGPKNPVPYRFGDLFWKWLESELVETGARLVVLDSYTALRPPRKPGDIVKTESEELLHLDALAKHYGCTILLLHHVSMSKLMMNWTDQGAGTYAIGHAAEATLHISRFQDLSGNAPERLLQGRPRHGQDLAAVVRFREPTLDYELIFEGGGSPFYPDILHMAGEFEDRLFTPKDLYHELGMARQTATKLINRLALDDVLVRCGRGEYRLSTAVLKQIRRQQ